MTLAARAAPIASTGAVITITASDTNSFVVKAFMRFGIASLDFVFAMYCHVAIERRHYKRRAMCSKGNKDQAGARVELALLS
ncbi:MAG TPA: hypothetical protein DCK99_09190 [Blastocatellia bacterium]|nr:hypothetical protein [Blastocatellia bacterium]